MAETPKKIEPKPKATERRAMLRKKLWPDVAEDALWLRTQRTGFTTIPRTMSLIGRIIDLLSDKGFPLFGTYLPLWCWVYDEGMVEIGNPRDFAFESGFSGPRAEATWKNRMERLKRLGFIDSRRGVSGEFHYVLIYNPLVVIERYFKDDRDNVAYRALLSRLHQVGADDIDFLV